MDRGGISMTKSYNLSLMIGMAYVSLALFSLIMDFPIKLINSLSLAALLFSISELIETVNNKAIRKNSLLNCLEDNGDNKVEVALSYASELVMNRIRESKKQVSPIMWVSMAFKTFAIMCIIVYPHIPCVDVIEKSSRFSAFCTILSLGIMLISFNFNDDRVIKEELLFEEELFHCYKIAFDDSKKDTEKFLEKCNNKLKEFEDKSR